MKNDCVFCAIAAGEIPSFKVYEDELVYAFLDINPMSLGHVLVVPKAHSADLLETDDAVLADVIVRVKNVARHVVGTLGCDGFNLLQNNGAAAGQTVRHIHFHIIPRKNGEPLVFDSKPGDMEALKTLGEKLAWKK